MHSRLLLQSLCDGPLFIQSLPEAPVFDRADLLVPDHPTPLNLQQKLGHLHEDALAQLLSTSERYDILEQGLQIQRGRHKTVGELDFLLKDNASETLIHLELAVKFYLAINTAAGLHLPGPDARDNYYNKLERLRTHQLTLTERFPELLPPAYQDTTIYPRHLVIGCVFDHINERSIALPEYMNPGARRGLWARRSEFTTAFPVCTSPLVIPKSLWSVDQVPESGLEPLDPEAPLSRCTLVKVSTEEKPVFITPDDYPRMEAHAR